MKEPNDALPPPPAPAATGKRKLSMHRWPVLLQQPSQPIPLASREDIGRRVFRLGPRLEPFEVGWAAIGVVVGFTPLQERRGSKGSTVEGEIGDAMATLHRGGHADAWDVLYGNGDVHTLDVGGILHGLQLYHKVKGYTADVQKTYGVTAKMMQRAGDTPPGIKTVVLKRAGALLPPVTVQPKNPRGHQPSSASSSSSSSSSSRPLVAEVGMADIPASDGYGIAASQPSHEADDVDRIVCTVCGSGDGEGDLLLCDFCDRGCHLGCANPPLSAVPVDDWFCDACLALAAGQHDGPPRHAVSRVVRAVSVPVPTVPPPSAPKKCPECAKEFTSDAGYDYHVQYVCVGDMGVGLALGKRRLPVAMASQGRVVATRRAFPRPPGSDPGHAKDEKEEEEEDDCDDDNGSDGDDVNFAADYVACKHAWQSTPAATFAAQFILPPPPAVPAAAQRPPDAKRRSSSVATWCASCADPSDPYAPTTPRSSLWVRTCAGTSTTSSSSASSSSSSSVGPADDGRLVAPYEAAPSPGATVDTYINAGAPVWDVAFAPTTFVDRVRATDASSTAYHVTTKHLAVATSRVGFPCAATGAAETLTGTRDVGDDMPHAVGATRAFPNLLQVWAVATHVEDDDGAALMNASGSPALARGHGHGHGHGRGFQSTDLLYCVEMTRGAHWQAVWSPMRANGDVLGVLALVCGDGSCAVLQPPRSAAPPGGGDGGGGGKTAADRTPVLPAGAVPTVEVRRDGRAIVSAAWSPHDPALLCGGLDDGSVALWTVRCGPTGVHEAVLTTVLSDPAAAGRAPAAVRAVSFSPYSPQLVLAGGYAADTKVWNVNAPANPSPVFRHAARPGWCHDARWDPQGNGVYGVYSDTAHVLWESPAGVAGQGQVHAAAVPRALYVHAAGASVAAGTVPAGVWRVVAFVADGQTAVASVAADGTARLAIPSLLAAAAPRREERRRRRVGGGAVWEPFRVCGVTHRREGSDDVVDVHVSVGTHRSPATTASSTSSMEPMQADPATALHAVDAAPFEATAAAAAAGGAASGGRLADAPCHLLAYGGAAGLIRVHAVDLKALVMTSAR